MGELKVGQEVTVQVDAFQGQSFVGKVVQISPEGKNQSNVITFETKIEITDENKHKLKSQMTAGVEIVVAKKNQILLVPSDAIISHGNKKVVNVVGDNKVASERLIEVGITDGVMTEVCSGLKINESISIPIKNIQSKWSKNSSNDRGQRPPMMF